MRLEKSYDKFWFFKIGECEEDGRAARRTFVRANVGIDN